jgi:hypothetical protein
MKLIPIILFAGPVLFAGPAAAEQVDANAVKSFCTGIRVDKKQIVAANLPFTEAETKRFWTAYESYQDELQKISIQ